MVSKPATKTQVDRRESRVQPSTSNGTAFGETLGIDVPTRYTEEIHSMVNALLAADVALMPTIIGLSGRTVWLCRVMAGVLVAFRSNITELPLRRRLEIEAALGALLVIASIRGMITHRFFDNLYLFLSGAVMIGNALMTKSQ